MLGYWHKDELSKEMLKPGNLPGERILCSNDWFKMDEDGFLYFQGRNDDIIKTRGEKVSPVEIENVIYKIDGVKEVAVIGIPDERMGEVAMACVVKKADADLTEEQLITWCREKMANYKVPRKVAFIDALPLNATGKVQKFVLKERFAR